MYKGSKVCWLEKKFGHLVGWQESLSIQNTKFYSHNNIEEIDNHVEIYI